LLYVFAGFPGKNLPLGWYLHVGGLRHCIEVVENLAVLDYDPAIQYRKEGVYTPGEQGELLYPVEYRLSDLCLRYGITWNWFPENWSFGHGVVIHKTMASPIYKTVVHGTDLSLNEYIRALDGDRWVSEQRQAIGIPILPSRVKLSDIELEISHIRTEGWEKYESRWLPGTCPQETHVVHLTWLVTTHRLPEFAYNRIRDLIEWGAEPKDLHLYSREPGKHFSETRRYDGKPAFRQGGGDDEIPAAS